MNGDGLREPRMNTRSSLNHSERATREPQATNSRILNFDPLVRECRRESGYVAYRAHEPGKKIDIVNRLIHQGTAAVQRASSFPAAFVVVGLGPPPLASGFSQRKTAESSRHDGGFQCLVRVAETRRKDRAQLYTVTITRVDDLIAAFKRDVERFFDDNMLAGGRRRDCWLHMGTARRGHYDN